MATIYGRACDEGPAADSMLKQVIFQANHASCEKDFVKAIDLYTKAIFIRPTSDTYTKRSYCQYTLGNIEESLADAVQALEIDPGYSKAWRRRGKALVALKRFIEAEAAFEKVYELEAGDCDDIGQELGIVRIMSLMDFGFTQETAQIYSEAAPNLIRSYTLVMERVKTMIKDLSCCDLDADLKSSLSLSQNTNSPTAARQSPILSSLNSTTKKNDEIHLPYSSETPPKSSSSPNDSGSEPSTSTFAQVAAIAPPTAPSSPLTSSTTRSFIPEEGDYESIKGSNDEERSFDLFHMAYETPIPPEDNTYRVVVIGNLSSSVKRANLRHIFNKSGLIKWLWMPREVDPSQDMMHAFVEYTTGRMAQEAVDTYNNKAVATLSPNARCPLVVSRRMAKEEKDRMIAATPPGHCYEYYHKQRCFRGQDCRYVHDQSKHVTSIWD